MAAASDLPDPAKTSMVSAAEILKLLGIEGVEVKLRHLNSTRSGSLHKVTAEAAELGARGFSGLQTIATTLPSVQGHVNRRRPVGSTSRREASRPEPWVEKNLKSWANSRIKDLLGSLESLEFLTWKVFIDGVQILRICNSILVLDGIIMSLHLSRAKHGEDAGSRDSAASSSPVDSSSPSRSWIRFYGMFGERGEQEEQ